jgi:hypothetical protein
MAPCWPGPGAWSVVPRWPMLEAPSEENYDMGIAILLLILALVFGGIGLLVEGLMWLLIIAVVLAIAGAVTGGRGRSRA